ncbi:MAG: hypothetical protein IJQ89_08995 [Bacteroidales bacterium]|jgi:hypothetical protein|nr:hypothetical protein [Bacteroidales bacterium]
MEGMYVDLNALRITLDSSVKHISKTACMALSGSIENGLLLSRNPDATIVIYNDRIDFGKCLEPELATVSGRLGFIPNFFKEYGNIVYRFGSNLKCSFFGKTIDYTGMFPPTSPDNYDIYQLLYPKFA